MRTELGTILEETVKVDPNALITYNDVTISVAQWLRDDTSEGLAEVVVINSRLTEPNGNYRTVNMNFDDDYRAVIVLRYLNPHMEITA